MRDQLKRTKQKAAGILLVCLLGVFALWGCTQPQERIQEEPGGDFGAAEQPQAPEPAPTELVISAAGDVMVHATQITAQHEQASDTYNFDNNFQYVKPYLEKADMAICNVETTFAGKERGYSGYPMFNAPDEMAQALAKAGFDIAVTANNHSLDTGAEGLLRTMDVLNQNGLVTAGTHREGEPRFALTEIKGVKAGIVAYTYETPQANGRRTLNAGYIPESMLACLNSFGYETLQQDVSRILQDIQEARAAGAEVVVCVMHWGQEYHEKPSDIDKGLALQLASGGADVIFASHPHVIQPVEILTAEDGREVPVFYSMGNFLSNQRRETLDSRNRKTEDGMIATVRLQVLQGKVTLLNTSVLSTWVNRYDGNGKKIYSIIPIRGDYKANPSIMDSRNQNAVEESRQDSLETVGQWWQEE